VHPSYRAVLGYYGSSLSHDVYLDSVIGDILLTLAGECVSVRNKSLAG
jgi:hypothetical protein